MKKSKPPTQSPFGTWGQVQLSDGSMPGFRFNGHEYIVTPNDEQDFLESAYKGNTGAQHGLGIIYLEKADLNNALYWLCVAEYNGEKQATPDINYLISGSQNPQLTQQWVTYYRDQVVRNPVHGETLEDIINEMKQKGLISGS